jgi:large subunit ribosomal protein L25
MQTVVIEGTSRPALGKKASADARRSGLVPCVIYGGDTNVQFTAPLLAFRSLVYTPEFKLAQINLDGKTYRAIVKEIQYHPLSDTITHIDFMELVDGRTIRAAVPVRVTGSSVGVKKGGKLAQSVRKVKIKTTPEKLVDSVEVDITELDLGKSVRVRDIVVQDGVEILNAPSLPLATIEIPRALRSQQAEEAAAAGKKK